jgi:hypothetical protein
MILTAEVQEDKFLNLIFSEKSVPQNAIPAPAGAESKFKNGVFEIPLNFRKNSRVFKTHLFSFILKD